MDKINEEFSQFNSEEHTDEEALNFIKEKIRDDMKKYLNVQRLGKESPAYDQVYNYYLRFASSYTNISFKEFLSIRAQASSNLLSGLRHYKDIFGKQIKIESLVDCFDYDAFCLVLAKTNLDECLQVEKQTGKVYNIANYLQMYSLALDVIKNDNPQYRCVIKYPTVNEKIAQYSSDELIRDYNALLVRHPEFSINYVNIKKCAEMLQKMGFNNEFINNFDPSTSIGRETLEMLVKASQGQEASANWVFIRRGERPFNSTSESEDYIKSSESNYSHKILSEEEAIRRMLQSRQYLQNSGWLYRVQGIRKFEGYEGFVYPNGHVIFEKFYENIDTKEVAKSSATYVMNIYNFIELSKLSKQEIIQLIGSGNLSGVYRVYHSKDMSVWMSKIQQFIQGGYTDGVIEYIDGLMTQGTLNKEGGKKNGFN